MEGKFSQYRDFTGLTAISCTGMSPGPRGGDAPSYTAPGRRKRGSKRGERWGEGACKGGTKLSKSRRNKRRHKLVCLNDCLNSCVYRGKDRERDKRKRNMDRRRIVSERVDRIGEKKETGDEESV